MADKFQDVATALAKATSPDTYYKLQVKAWTRFDPSKSELIDIAGAVESGSAFLSAIEVTRVAKSIQEIDDVDIREQFETLAAAERILHRMEELPQAVLDKLRSAMGKSENRERIAG